MKHIAWGLAGVALAAAVTLRMGASVSAAEPDAWLDRLPAPAYSQPAPDDADARVALAQQVQAYAARGYRVHLRQVFAVAADTTPDLVRKNFANAAAEQGAKPLAYDGPQLHEHGLSVAAFFQQGWVRTQRFGVAMQRAQPGQANATVLVAYFSLSLP